MIKFIIIFCLLSQVSFGLDGISKKEKVILDEVNIEKKTKFLLYGEYFSASNSELGSSISGPSIGFGVRYGLNEKVSIGGAVKQNFSSLGASASFTSIELNSYYSQSVSMIKKDQKFKVNNEAVLEGLKTGNNGVLYGLHVSQYIFNGTNAALPLTGLGTSVNYEFNTSNMSYSVGGRLDYLVNGDTTITPITISIGVGFWL